MPTRCGRQDLLQMLSKELLIKDPPNMHENASLSLLRLPHPRTGEFGPTVTVAAGSLRRAPGVPTLFLPYEHPNEGRSTILEVQAVSPPNARSWFLSEEVLQGEWSWSGDHRDSNLPKARWQTPNYDPN